MKLALSKNSMIMLGLSLGMILLCFFLSYISIHTGSIDLLNWNLFYILRAPRTIMAIAAGGGLALSGVLIQSAFLNPLADPYTLGIAAAASLGYAIGQNLNLEFFAGSRSIAMICSVTLIFLMYGYLRNRFFSSNSLILAGVVVSLFLNSVTSVLNSILDPSMAAQRQIWLSGSLHRSDFLGALICLSVVITGLIISLLFSRKLDLMSTDESIALTSGVDTSFYRKSIFILVSIMTVFTVSEVGVIGFVGIVIPQLLRRFGISSHHILLPLSFVGGANLLLCSDILGRVISKPYEIPAGLLTSLIGAPLFIYLSLRSRNA